MVETSLATMILERVERYGSKWVLLHKRDGHWQEDFSNELRQFVTKVAA